MNLRARLSFYSLILSVLVFSMSSALCSNGRSDEGTRFTAVALHEAPATKEHDPEETEILNRFNETPLSLIVVARSEDTGEDGYRTHDAGPADGPPVGDGVNLYDYLISHKLIEDSCQLPSLRSLSEEHKKAAIQHLASSLVLFGSEDGLTRAKDQIQALMRDLLFGRRYLSYDDPNFMNEVNLSSPKHTHIIVNRTRLEDALRSGVAALFEGRGGAFTLVLDVTTERVELRDRHLPWGLDSLAITSSNRALKEVGDDFLHNCHWVKFVEFPGFMTVGSIGANFLRLCVNVGVLDFSRFCRVIEIGDNFVQSCLRLRKICHFEMPVLTHLGAFPFRGNVNLEALDLSQLPRITHIGGRPLFGPCSFNKLVLHMVRERDQASVRKWALELALLRNGDMGQASRSGAAFVPYFCRDILAFGVILCSIYWVFIK